MKAYIFLSIILLLVNIQIIYSKNIFQSIKNKKDRLDILKFSKFSGKDLKKYILNYNVFIIDTRDMAISAVGYIPNSILVPTTMFSWLSSIIPVGSNVIIITDEENKSTAIDQFISLNLYKLLGYGIYNEINESASFSIQVVEYNPNTRESIQKIVDDDEYIIDIREIAEYKETGVIEKAKLIPLTTFPTDFYKIPMDGDVYVYCKSGMRAVVGMTYAKRAGFINRFIIMQGGMNKAIEEGFPLVPYSG
jgi:hydroxyacylglutathione hydrolase